MFMTVRQQAITRAFSSVIDSVKQYLPKAIFYKPISSWRRESCCIAAGITMYMFPVQAALLPAYDDGEQMATLSIIALRINDNASRNWIQQQASENTRLATQGMWDLSWLGRNDHKAVAACIFTHKVKKNTYAIAVKGQKASSIDDMFHGIGILWQDNWPFSEPKVLKREVFLEEASAEEKAKVTHKDIHRQEAWDFPLYKDSNMKVSVGAKDYIRDILALEDSFGDKSDQTISAVVDQLLEEAKPTADNPLTLYVTGDSLGGTGAVLMATYLYGDLKQRSLPSRSIYLNVSISNAPALYNEGFVEFYNQLTADRELPVTQRFYSIEHDVVSNYFAHNIDGLPPGILNISQPLEDILKVPFNALALYLSTTGQHYAQVGSIENKTKTLLVNRAPNPLPGKIASPADLVQYYEYYHFPDSLFDSLGIHGIPHVPCPPRGCVEEQ